MGIPGFYRHIVEKYSDCIDSFNFKKPELYFVEVELDTHHAIKHIATQILNFSLAFDEDKNGICEILIKSIEKDEKIKEICLKYASNSHYENLHNFI